MCVTFEIYYRELLPNFIFLRYTLYTFMCKYMRMICIRTCVCTYKGKGKNVGGEHHVFFRVSRRTRANGRRHPLHAYVRMYYAVWRGTVLTGSMHPHESEGLESHSTPLFFSLCLSRSLKWPPSRRSLIGPELPSFCVLRTLPFPRVFSFSLSFCTSNALIVDAGVYLYLLSQNSSFLLAYIFKLHSGTIGKNIIYIPSFLKILFN